MSHDVESRIVSLERSLRRLRRLTVALALLLIAAVAMAQAQAGGVLSNLRTRKLTVYNEKNEPFFVVAADQEGKGQWSLLHEGKPIIMAFHGKYGATVNIVSEGVKTGTFLVADKGGKGGIILYDKSNNEVWTAP